PSTLSAASYRSIEDIVRRLWSDRRKIGSCTLIEHQYLRLGDNVGAIAELVVDHRCSSTVEGIAVNARRVEHRSRQGGRAVRRLHLYISVARCSSRHCELQIRTRGGLA